MSRNPLSAGIRDYAQRLVNHESALYNQSGAAAIALVVDGLRRPLSALIGVNGFSVLLSRALTLTQMELSHLGAVEVKLDGSIEGLNNIPSDEIAEAGVLLIGRVLALLATFIGENLMLHVLADAWPDLALSRDASSGESKHDPRR